MRYEYTGNVEDFQGLRFDIVNKFSGKTGTIGTQLGGWAHDISFTSSGGNVRHQILGGGVCGADLSTYGDWITLV